MLIVSYLWVAIVTLLIVRAIRQCMLFRRLATPVQPLINPPRLAVILPMRDESANVGGCLDSLCAQNYPDNYLTIIVVDDHSNDETAEIAMAIARRCSRLHVLRSPPLPSHWVGKSHACWIGAEAAAFAEWLCFIDADVRCAPRMLSIAMRTALAEQLDFLSVAPRHELGSFAERLILPCGHYFLAFSQDLRKRQAPDNPDVSVTGQFLLIRQEVYAKIGGHAAICKEICEDAALARLAKKAGYKVELRSGQDLLSTRMYRGWRSLWPGLGKNIVEMVGGPARTLSIALVALALAWASLLLPGMAAVNCYAANSCAPLAIALLGSAAAFGFHLAGAAHFGIPLWYGLIFPLGYTIGGVIALDGVRRRWQRRVTWKGRTYP